MYVVCTCTCTCTCINSGIIGMYMYSSWKISERSSLSQFKLKIHVLYMYVHVHVHVHTINYQEHFSIIIMFYFQILL